MFEITVKDHFCAAHFLRGYQGKCAQLHGHTWNVEVIFLSEHLNEIGLVVDFVDLKKLLKDILDELDHKNLNDLDYFQKQNPTTENIAKWIYDRCKNKVEGCQIKHARVWESDRCSVIYYE